MFAAQDPQVALDAARGRWKDAAIADYRFEVGRSCFCQPVPPTRIRVRRGKAVRPPEALRSVATVPRLFRLVQQQIDGQGIVSVRYGRRGVPLSIRADPIPMAIDDEFTVTASHLRRER